MWMNLWAEHYMTPQLTPNVNDCGLIISYLTSQRLSTMTTWHHTWHLMFLKPEYMDVSHPFSVKSWFWITRHISEHQLSGLPATYIDQGNCNFVTTIRSVFPRSRYYAKMMQLNDLNLTHTALWQEFLFILLQKCIHRSNSLLKADIVMY